MSLLTRVLASRWLPIVLVAIALGVSGTLWKALLVTNYPTTPPLTALEQRYGQRYDVNAIAPFRVPLPASFEVKGTFDDAIEKLRDSEVGKRNIFVHWHATQSLGIDRKTPVNAQLGGLPFDDAVERLLANLGGGAKLGMSLDDGVLTISTADDLARNTLTSVYDVRPLLPAGNARIPTPAQAAAENQLLADIQASIDPTSWRSPANGRGTGAVRMLQGNLIVTQTPFNQHELVRLLERRRWHADLKEFAMKAGPIIGTAVGIGIAQIIIVQWTRRRRNKLTGLCVKCGYDLRATPERCPECGASAEIGAPAVVG